MGGFRTSGGRGALAVGSRYEANVRAGQRHLYFAVIDSRDRRGAAERGRYFTVAPNNILLLNGSVQRDQHEPSQRLRAALAKPRGAMAAFTSKNAVRGCAVTGRDTPPRRYAAHRPKGDAPGLNREAFNAFVLLQWKSNDRGKIGARMVHWRSLGNHEQQERQSFHKPIISRPQDVRNGSIIAIGPRPESGRSSGPHHGPAPGPSFDPRRILAERRQVSIARREWGAC